MGRWFVQIPITGRIGCEVEANDEASAKEAAWKLYDNGELDPYEDVEWEATDRVTTGNVCHAMLHEIDASPIRARRHRAGKGGVMGASFQCNVCGCESETHGVCPFCGEGVARPVEQDENERPSHAPGKGE